MPVNKLKSGETDQETAQVELEALKAEVRKSESAAQSTTLSDLKKQKEEAVEKIKQNYDSQPKVQEQKKTYDNADREFLRGKVNELESKGALSLEDKEKAARLSSKIDEKDDKERSREELGKFVESKAKEGLQGEDREKFLKEVKEANDSRKAVEDAEKEAKRAGVDAKELPQTQKQELQQSASSAEALKEKSREASKEVKTAQEAANKIKEETEAAKKRAEEERAIKEQMPGLHALDATPEQLAGIKNMKDAEKLAADLKEQREKEQREKEELEKKERERKEAERKEEEEVRKVLMELYAKLVRTTDINPEPKLDI